MLNTGYSGEWIRDTANVSTASGMWMAQKSLPGFSPFSRKWEKGEELEALLQGWWKGLAFAISLSPDPSPACGRGECCL